MILLVTGGAGFIGSAVVRRAVGDGHRVVVVDKLTYAANPDNLLSVSASPLYAFEKADICERARMDAIFARYRPDAVLHLAAESHVDRSIDGPAAFIETNIVGTYTLLEAARDHWLSLEGDRRAAFRFLHVSTDEVFGSLGADGRFCETTPYAPRSPYSASKAASDHLVRAWHETYGLPTLITNCSNNYGPFHFPEKFIPVVILSAIEGRPIPVYGEGKNVRDWLYVDDHAQALLLVAARGQVGGTYNIGGGNECSNIDLVHKICAELDRLRPEHKSHARHIAYVKDRPGHDFRYAIDASKLKAELGWSPATTLESGLRETVRWYLENEAWWRAIRERGFTDGRLGLARSGAP